MSFTPIDFIRESNRIEGILRQSTDAECVEFLRFLGLPLLSSKEVVAFVKVYQPDAKLRTAINMNVSVGSHIAPPGGKQIEFALEDILDRANRGGDPWRTHCDYETLHPFTDCNGRSGRAIWAWQMRHQDFGFALGFLHSFYYQTLQRSHPDRPIFPDEAG